MTPKALLYILMCAVAAALCGCGDDERFRVAGTIEGNPTMNLRVSWYSDGAAHALITAARAGEFELQGSAPAGTVLEIADYENRLLGRTYVANGQELTLRLDRDNPRRIEASGNDAAAEWADFLRANADASGAAVNSAIADYIGSHPDRLVSTLLLTCDYDAAADPFGADSLMQLIVPAARPAALTESFNFLLQRMVQAGASEPVVPFRYLARNDSLRIFRPSDAPFSLLAMVNNRTGRADSVLPALKELVGRRHLAILEISLDSDSAEWKRNTRRDTATWTQTWGAAGFAARGIAPLAVPAVPYFIVCDSAGRQLLRTGSVAVLTDSLNNILRQ